ncbi:MAG: M48 family metallopeptidase [Acidimicrobiales bacterium]
MVDEGQSGQAPDLPARRPRARQLRAGAGSIGPRLTGPIPPPDPRRGLSTWRRGRSDPSEFFSVDELDRSRRYQQPLVRLRVARSVLGLAVAAVFVFGGVGQRVVDAVGGGWVVALVAMVLALEVASLVYQPALDWWVDMVHDHRWGVSTQTGRGFATDQLKSVLLTSVLEIVVLVPLYALVRSTTWWWLWGWALTVLFSVGLGFVFPIVIAPIFNRFTPLADDALAARIQEIASAAGVSIGGAWVADESRRSTRDNAYVAGLGATRRVVLYDTILEHPTEVVAQVVAHEIGHWRLHHLRRQIPLAAALALVVFLGLWALSRWTWLFDQAGATGVGDPVALPIVLVGLQVGFAVTGLVSSWVSRAFERQADLEALELLGEPDVMLDMQRRLHVKNLAELEPGRLRYLQLSHPPAAERMAFTRAWAATAVG